MSDSQQVKFLAGLKLDLANKASQSGLTPGALYFCTDEKKIFKATANNTYEAVNEEVSFGVLPEAANAFPGKLYLRQADMTLHVLNEAGDAFKQLSAPADALTPDKVSEDLEADDKKLLASKAAVKAGIKVVADDLTTETNARITGDTNTLADAKKYADAQDKILAGNYNTAGEGVDSNASGLRKEIEERIKIEKDRAESAESGLAGRLNTIEGTGEGSIKKAVADEAKLRDDADKDLAKKITDEATARTKADTALEKRIAAFEGDGAGSVAAQVGEVKDALNDLKNNVVGSPAVVDPENGTVTQDATGLFKEIANEKTARETKDTELDKAIKDEAKTARAAEEANATAIAEEVTRAKAAEKANADAITVLNGADTVEGSVKKQIKDAVAAEATLRETKDNELQGAIDNIEEALGLGGATGSASISSRLDSVEDRADALEAIVGHEAIPGGDGQEEQPATGLVKDVADLKAKDVELAAKDTSLQASIDTLNGGVEVAGSVAKAVAGEAALREAADNALDGRLDHLESVVEDENSGLVKKVADNTAAIATINGDGEGSIKKAVADLVDGAPAAMDTLKELAQAISDHQGVYEAYVSTVSGELAKKVDKIEGSRLVAETEVTKWNAKAETSDVNKALTDAKGYTDTEVKKVSDKVGDVSTLKTEAKGSAVSAINELKDNISAINNADTGILKQAKDYTDGKVGDLSTLETTAQGSAVLAINELKGAVDEINTALGSGGATGSISERLGDLESIVGDTQSGLVKDVADLKAADTALGNRLTTVEGIVGNEDSGLVKDVATNAAAIATINGEGEGSIKKALKDAKDYADQAEADAIAAAETKAGELDAALKTEIEKSDGVLMTAIKAEETRAKGVENGLDTRLKTVEDLTKEGGALEARVKAVETQAATNKAAIGDENSGLVKDVADNAAAIAENTTNISNNTAAIEIINGNENQVGSIAKALKDAKDYADQAETDANAYTDRKIGKPSVPGEGDAQGTPAEGLHAVIEAGDADTLADAKEYVDTEIGEASKPGEADKPGTPATGLHKVIEDGDTAAKEYADNAANTAANNAVTEALTWGSF